VLKVLQLQVNKVLKVHKVQ
jgi:hypothetical protein